MMSTSMEIDGVPNGPLSTLLGSNSSMQSVESGSMESLHSMPPRSLGPNGILHPAQRQISEDLLDQMQMPPSSSTADLSLLGLSHMPGDSKLMPSADGSMGGGLNGMPLPMLGDQGHDFPDHFKQPPNPNIPMNGSMKDGDDAKDADALVQMPKLPFFPSRSRRTGPPFFDQLDFSYNAELDVSLQLRKLEYSQLFNQYARMSTKIRALATLLKYELEEEHSHYLLRNNDVVIQICIDHDGALTNCFTSWYGGQLRVNEKLKLLLSQNRWVTILRLLRVMNQTIPNCVPMHERVNCLNGLIVLEQDLTVLFTENKLALQIYGKEDVEVFRPRTDLTPFTVALHWEMYKRRFSVAIKDVMSKESPLKHPLVAYLSVVYHEYMTLFPSASCLINNYNWAHLSDGIYTPGNYCLHFSRPVIVRRSMIQELIEDNGVTVYTLRPINWFRETSNSHDAKNAVVFGHSNKKQAGACHQYLFGEEIDQSADDFLIRRITFTAPKTVVGLITKLRRQASFIGLIRNLFEQASARRRLPYTDRLMVTIETPKATSLVLYFNHNNQVFGMINLEVLGHRFDIRINLGYGKVVARETEVAWEKLLMETWSIPKLMHRVVLDLTAANLLNVPNSSFYDQNAVSQLAQQVMPFSKFGFLRDAFSIKSKLPTSRSQFDFSQAFELDDSKQAHNRTSADTSPATAAASKRQAAFLRISPKRTWLLNDFHLRRQRTLRIKKAAAFRKLDVPPARRQALIKCLFTTRTRVPAVLVNQKDETRIPPLHIEARTPTILPLATSRLRTQLRALRLNRRHKLQAKKKAATIAQPENSKEGAEENAWWTAPIEEATPADRLVKKPRILRSSSSTPRSATKSDIDEEVEGIMASLISSEKPLPAKSVRVNAAIKATPTPSGSHTPNPNAQPKKSILSNPATRTNRPIKKTSFANGRPNEEDASSSASRRMNRLSIARKIRRPRRVNRRFFGALRGWRRVYGRFFRRTRRPPTTTPSFAQQPMSEVEGGSLLSVQAEREPEVDARLLFSPFSTDFGSASQRSVNSIQSNYGMADHLMNDPIHRPALGNTLQHQTSMDASQDGPLMDQRLMDLNASELAARRLERNMGAYSRPMGKDSEMSMDYDGFEDEDESSADEETDPPPPPKEGQQRFSRASMRRQRDNEAREKRQQENNKKMAERKKQQEQQEQEFAQRHQLPSRQVRPVQPQKAPMKDLSRMFSADSKDDSGDSGQETKATHEPLSIRLPRTGADSNGRREADGSKPKGEERKTSRAHIASKEDMMHSMDDSSQRDRSLSTSSSSSNSSSASSSSEAAAYEKVGAGRLKNTKVETRQIRRSRRSGDEPPLTDFELGNRRKSSRGGEMAAGRSQIDANANSLDQAEQKFRRHGFPPSRKDSIYKSKTESSESSSSDDEEDSSSSSSSTSPPPLAARLSRQESVGTDAQQDEESRQSGRSTSSIPPPPLLAAHEPIRGEAGSSHDRAGSRKSSTSTQSDLNFKSERQRLAQKDALKGEKDKGDSKFKPSSKTGDVAGRKEKKDKSKDKSRSTDDEKPRDKSEKFKDADRLKDKKPKEKNRELLSEADRLKLKKEAKEKEKLKEKSKKEKGAHGKGRESPQPRTSADLLDSIAERKKRKREHSEVSPVLPGNSRLSGTKEGLRAGKDVKVKEEKLLPKELRDKERRDPKDLAAARLKDAKGLKLKTGKESKESKLFTKELSPPPLRKRSPSGRKKEEAAVPTKKPRVGEDVKFVSISDKAARLKPIRSDEARTLKRPLPSTSQTATSDEKRRKLRKLEKSEKAGISDLTGKKDAKKTTTGLPDLPEFTGRPCLSNLKNFRIPKVVDSEAAKNAEKEKEKEKEKEREKDKEPPAADKEWEREPERRKEKDAGKEFREGTRDRWDRDDRREFYPHTQPERYAERRESYYDRGVGTFYPNEPTTPRENYGATRGGSFHYGRGNYHGMVPPTPTGYGASQRGGASATAFGAFPVHTDTSGSSSYAAGAERGGHFRGGRRGGGMAKPTGAGMTTSFDDRYMEHPAAGPLSRPARGAGFAAGNPARKPGADQISSPPQPYAANPNQRTPQYGGREAAGAAGAPTNWPNYPGVPPNAKDRSGFPPPGHPVPYHHNATAPPAYQTPPGDRFDGRDFRPYRDRTSGVSATESAHSGGAGGDSSPTEGLQIDEET